MLIKTLKASDSKESEVTSESLYISRRRLLSIGVSLAGGALLPASASAARYEGVEAAPAPEWLQRKLKDAHWADPNASNETLTPYRHVTSYNNFYELGPDKSDPARNASALKTEPWTVVIDGEVSKPGRFDLASLLAPHRLLERIYRLRCVEGWSMVIPWLGVPLADVLSAAEPNGHARYVRFESVLDKQQLPGQRSGFSLLDWPYAEGLRLDEAMHPLALLAVGVYGRVLPAQNGAPIRLVVPWKYGFKSSKAIVRISLLREQPATTWQSLAPEEYGFYANVNPHVDHPRWSQARERRLPGSLFAPNVIPTRLFNGYDEVAELYRGMDLVRNY